MSATTTTAVSQYDPADLACLYEITKALASSSDLRDCVEEIMEILATSTGMQHGTVTILNPITGQLEIEVGHDLSEEARRRGVYKIGEGITGRVVASGAPIVVPQISAEPLFLNRTGTRGDLDAQQRSFMCVPIKRGRDTIGALSIDRSTGPA